MDPIDIARKARSGAARFIGVVRQLHGVELHYDRESVAWLSAHISSSRARWQREIDRDTYQGMRELMGCYLGECLVHVHGGRWVDFDGAAVEIKDPDGELHFAFPFSKVARHCAEGAAEDVLAFFDAIPLLSTDESNV